MPRLTLQQLRDRHAGIGSSDVAAILDVSPFDGSNPHGLFAEKSGPLELPESCNECGGLGKHARGDDCDACDGSGIAADDEDVAQALGHAVEPVLIRFYERRAGIKTEPGGTVYSAKYPWAFATVDAHEVGRLHGLEVKFVGGMMIRRWDKLLVDGVSHDVRVQNTWQMFVTGYERMTTIAMLGGPSGFQPFMVERDPELEGLVVPVVVKFWDDVKAGRAPAIDGSDECRAYLNQKYPPIAKDVEIEVSDPEIIALGIDHCTAANVIKDSTAHRADVGNKIIAYMGQNGATVAKCAEWRAIYRPNKKLIRSLRLVPLGELAQKASFGPTEQGGDDDAF